MASCHCQIRPLSAVARSAGGAAARPRFTRRGYVGADGHFYPGDHSADELGPIAEPAAWLPLLRAAGSGIAAGPGLGGVAAGEGQQ